MQLLLQAEDWWKHYLCYKVNKETVLRLRKYASLIWGERMKI